MGASNLVKRTQMLMAVVQPRSQFGKEKPPSPPCPDRPRTSPPPRRSVHLTHAHCPTSSSTRHMPKRLQSPRFSGTGLLEHRRGASQLFMPPSAQ